MKINFASSFEQSLNKMIRHQRWWYITWLTVRYDIPRFIKNVWFFRKSLWNTYWWDHHGPLMYLQTAFERMANSIETLGLEVDSSRLKKVEKMRRAAQLLKNYTQDLYIEMAEAELGELVLHDWEFEPAEDRPGSYQLVDKDTPEEREHNRRVFERARKIQEAEWSELTSIIGGQDYSKFENDVDWNDQFDGTGIRGWWD